MKVYIVTTGSYSDYSIDSIFSTKKLADAFTAKLQESGADVNEVAEFDVDEPDKLNTVVKDAYTCCISIATGEIWEGCYYNPGAVWRAVEKRLVLDNARSEDKLILDYGHGECLPRIQVTSYVSREHAHKLAVEARQEYLRSK